MQQIRLFRTSDLSLAPFLFLNGLIYVGTELDIKEANKIVFIFQDDNNLGRDLSMLFYRSEEKKYHDMWAFFRNELSKAKKLK